MLADLHIEAHFFQPVPKGIAKVEEVMDGGAYENARSLSGYR
jgi:hypothetical protein